MHKKKLLFVIPGFTLGGTISSLLALLNNLDYNKYDVDIYSRSFLGYNKSFEGLSHCRILNESIWLSATVRSRGRVIKLISQFLQLLVLVCRKLGINIIPLYSKIGCKEIETEKYDTIIAYQESMAEILSFWTAKRKIIWIHSDYVRNKEIEPKVISMTRHFGRFDNIVCVSKSAQNSFCNVFPELREKTSVVYNIIDKDVILKKASEKITLNRCFDLTQYAIISCGRIDPVKQFHLIPMIANELKSKNCIPFKWYILGGDRGFDTYKESIQKNIEHYNLSDIVLFLGEQSNVYPYIYNSDILVSLSESETFALVIHEALTLGKPVIMNDIPVAHELLIENEYECICNVSEISDNIIRYMRERPVVKDYADLNEIAINSFNRLLL